MLQIWSICLSQKSRMFSVEFLEYIIALKYLQKTKYVASQRFVCKQWL